MLMKRSCRLLCLVLSVLIYTLYAPFSAAAGNDSLPSRFDPTHDGKVTPVRQTPQAYDLCWCYSTVGAMEQSLIFTGLDNASVDLSESALAWFSSSSEKGALSDQERYGSNFIIAPVYAMARLCGVVNEIDEPTYLSAPYKNPVSFSLQGLSEFELESVEKVTGDTELVKKKLMQLGGAAVCYHNDLDAFSSDHKSYYQSERSDVNHSVTVIGWDDNYSKDNFDKQKPDKDGAWLVKSVWGTRNDNGYYWISYCETELKDFYFYKLKKAASDTVYTHNGGMDRMYASSKNPVQAANVFTAQSDEKLTSVSFFVEENGGQGTEYKIRIFKELKEDSAIDGIECADIDGTVQFDGYYTVNMPSEIKLSKGERFSVVISLKSGNGKNFFVAEDSNCESEKGQTYYYTEEKGWQDCTELVYNNAYINAYTQKTGSADTSRLKAKLKELENKRGMQRAVSYAKSVIDKTSPSFLEVSKAEKLLESRKNECDSYTVITTAEEWNSFAKDVNSGNQYRDKTVVVESDIDFENTEFIPAGISQDRCFNGFFDGGGHSFKNIKINTPGSTPAGVIGYVGRYGCISELNVTDCEIKAKTAGGIVGICTLGTVNCCGFSGKIKADICGGIVGRLESGTVSECWSDIKDANGMIGECLSENINVVNCFSTAKDKLESVKKTYAVRKIAELLNTNGEVSSNFGHFEYAKGVVKRVYSAKDESHSDNDNKSRIWIGFVIFPVVSVAACAVGFALSSSRNRKKPARQADDAKTDKR